MSDDALLRALVRELLDDYHLGDFVYAVRERAASDASFTGNTWEHPRVVRFGTVVAQLARITAALRPVPQPFQAPASKAPSGPVHVVPLVPGQLRYAWPEGAVRITWVRWCHHGRAYDFVPARYPDEFTGRHFAVYPDTREILLSCAPALRPASDDAVLEIHYERPSGQGGLFA